ncbi:hypothetical protein TWF730_002552 [Orbilia blumenaviensis]|uniref:Uncharacterized protein n=1 Tax=Orbilia blumenaviensis TaxID=1796055 RepID=A0AAV9UDQ4_9PEZI
MKSITPITHNPIWTMLSLLPLLQATSAFYIEAAVGSGEYFSRAHPLKIGSGKPEFKGPYECGLTGEIFRLSEQPVDGVAVWNRPDSQAILALALYTGLSCNRSRGTHGQRPKIMILLDPNRIRGVHVVSFQQYELSAVCKSWQGVSIQEEMKVGGALHGYDHPKLLAGSLIYWDDAGIRTIELDAVKWINAIPYEPLTLQRQISQYLREVVEVHVNPRLAVDSKYSGAKILMKSINGFLGIDGSEIRDPPFLKEYLPQLKLDVDDSYESFKTVPGSMNSDGFGRGDPRNTQSAPRKPQLIQGIDILGQDNAGIDDIRRKKIPINEIIKSFNKVPDKLEEKRAWYRGVEARMAYNLQVLANAWRTLWAWEKANSELATTRPENVGLRQSAGLTGRQDSSVGQRTEQARGMSGLQGAPRDVAGLITNRLDPNRVGAQEEVERVQINRKDAQGIESGILEISDDEDLPEVPQFMHGIQDIDAQSSGSGVSDFFGDVSRVAHRGGNQGPDLSFV